MNYILTLLIIILHRYSDIYEAGLLCGYIRQTDTTISYEPSAMQNVSPS